MAENYVLLETIELTQTASSVTFDNIPQTGYTDLKIAVSARSTSANTAVGIQFNSDTSTNYSSRRLGGDATASYSGSSSATNMIKWIIVPFSTATANTFGTAEVYVPNYTSTSFQKCILLDSISENNSGSKDAANIEMNAGLWSKTPEAISSITLIPSSDSFAANSTFSLYGIADVNTTPAIASKATGGNIVANDGTYWYHAFLTSGTFTPQTALTCDVLTIAGGGSGGNNASGGGGAGGLLYSSAQSVVSATNYTVTIGAGGANQTSYSSSGFNGSNTTFSGSGFTTLTAIGGGGGQGPVSTPAGSGGSGGGASGYSGSSARGTGTSGQGNNGGTATVPGESGGGGGAGAVGGNGGNNSARSGVGGAGVNTYSSWASATNTGVSGYYAGGGGGGAGQSTSSGTAGGSGGGGTGAGVDQNTLATAGVANTGSGGGGTGYGNTSGSSNTGGGSGIVIIRYAMA